MRVRVGDGAAAVGTAAEHTAGRGWVHGWPPAGPEPIPRGHDGLPGPGPRPLDNRVRQFVEGQLGVPQGIADGLDDPVGLLLGHERLWRQMSRRDPERGERPGPQRQVPRWQQMHGASGAEGLDEGVLGLEGGLDRGAGCAAQPDAHGELRGGHHLGVGPADRGDGIGRAGVGPRLGQSVPGQPPAARLRPGERARLGLAPAHLTGRCRSGPCQQTLGPPRASVNGGPTLRCGVTSQRCGVRSHISGGSAQESRCRWHRDSCPSGSD